MPSKRQFYIRRRRIFLCGLCAAVAALIGITVLIVTIIGGLSADNSSSESSVSSEASSEQELSEPSVPGQKAPEYVTRGEYSLDANYERLLLVNGEHPLPADYDYGSNLSVIENKYINGFRNQIDKDILPYMKAMIEAAWEDGVELYVLSPYRSYEAQETLFNNKVQYCLANGVSEENAESEAASVVARPGTSEHNTGLAADFNMVEDEFEQTPMYEWLQKNAADYGFIMRYSEEKTEKTGVIHESWHWRFVGINTAKEINSLGMCLEEYIEYKGYEPQYELNKASEDNNSSNGLSAE